MRLILFILPINLRLTLEKCWLFLMNRYRLNINAHCHSGMPENVRLQEKTDNLSRLFRNQDKIAQARRFPFFNFLCQQQYTYTVVIESMKSSIFVLKKWFYLPCPLFLPCRTSSTPSATATYAARATFSTKPGGGSPSPAQPSPSGRRAERPRAATKPMLPHQTARHCEWKKQPVHLLRPALRCDLPRPLLHLFHCPRSRFFALDGPGKA